jgi:RNA polymerase sigma-70 factor (ECF subfamily)
MEIALNFIGKIKQQVAKVIAPEIDENLSMIDAARNGDRVAFGKLYKQYAPMVHAIMLARVPRIEVEDLVQDVFVIALNRIHTLREPKAFGAWLCMVARNRALDFLRSVQIQTELSDEVLGHKQPETEALAILNTIRSLPEAYRETLIMRLVEGMTGPEIAEQTGMTPDSVRVNLSRGMKMLREKLGSEAEYETQQQ